MKRSIPIRNSSLSKSMSYMDREQRNAARQARIAGRVETALSAPRSRGVMARVVDCVLAVPKPQERRNPHLLAMAKDMPCLLAITGVCLGHDSQTSVACHSNFGRHGKGGARKADDHYTVWGCMACHRWLDQGPAPIEEKQAAFDRAHQAQLIAWADIACDSCHIHSPQDRKAAQWALGQYIADAKERS